MSLDTIPSTEGGKFKAIASGALPNGKPVVVNADGTVSVVAESSATEVVGSPVAFEAATVESTVVTHDSANNKIVIAYADNGNSGFGTAIVGTVSGASISFGSAVVYRSAYTNNLAITYDAVEERVVISYRDLGNSSFGTAIVGTVSGTSISFGTPVVFESADSRELDSVYDISNQKIVISYQDIGNSSFGTAIVGTVSGTSISFGTPVVFESAASTFNSLAFDSLNSKVLVAYKDGATTHGTAVVGTVSGTSISFGTPVVFEAASTEDVSCAYDTQNEKIVVAYRDVGNSQYGTAIVGTVSGTSISFGSPSVFDTVEVRDVSAVYDAAAQRVVISYNKSDPVPQAGRVSTANVSGTSLSFTTPVAFEGAESQGVSSVYDTSAEKVVIVYADIGNSSHGTAVVYQTGYNNVNLTAENYIGISSGGTVADTGNATVDIVGTVNRDQSGLTAGQQYYVQTDGTLSETPADPSVLAGTAVSATKLVVKS